MTNLKILVVDDEPGIRSGVIRIMQNFKVDYPFMEESITFETLDASTGEEGIEKIEKEKPDIILLDNKLPGMQGIEVLEYIKNKQLNIIVVMITSFASLELAVKATRDGAYDFIPKPFTPQELRSSMENIAKHLFLKQMTQKLQKEGKQIRFQFLSVLSHELKAPLNAVEGYLRIIQEKQFGVDVNNYTDIIERSLSRMTAMRSMIMDLLDLTYIESGNKKRNIQEINIAAAAQSSIDTMMPYAIQKDVEVFLHTEKTIIFNADFEEFEIIFNNLISNAIKYNKNNGKVDCWINNQDNGIEIIVKDTGIGMNEEEISRLFNDFVRIKNQQTKNISGSGLGLSIVKKITEIYKGSIAVVSEPNQGSTFTINIPKN
ncbi:MAG: ATP-binding protein [Bacteroidota bacterium]